jgi:ubiquitin C-terminal hydrolase
MGTLCSRHSVPRYKNTRTAKPSGPYNFSYIKKTPSPEVHQSFENQRSSNHSQKNSGPSGLPNLGNTCFANAALQCILNTEALKSHLSQSNSFSKFTSELKSIFASQGKLDPSGLLKLVWKKSQVFRPYEQNDAHEFIVFLLDQLHEEMKVPAQGFQNQQDLDITKAEKSWIKYMEQNSSLVSREFQGLLKNSLVCLNCKKIKERFEPFMYLSLSIPVNGESSIEKCLKDFQDEDLLDGNNRWFCKNCGSLEETTKKTEFARVPNHLIVHFKRFKDAMRKNCNFIGYGERVSLMVDGVVVGFELYAKIKHVGSMGGGHYVAVAKQGNSWFCFNDSSVDQTSFRPSADTYLLFYKRA